MAARPDRECISARLAKPGVTTYFPAAITAWGGGEEGVLPVMGV